MLHVFRNIKKMPVADTYPEAGEIHEYLSQYREGVSRPVAVDDERDPRLFRIFADMGTAEEIPEGLEYFEIVGSLV